MYLLPKSNLVQWKGIAGKLEGAVVYAGGHQVNIPTASVDDAFEARLVDFMQKMTSPVPPRRVPSGPECGFCELTGRGLPGACGSDVGLTSECFFAGPSEFSVRAACGSAEQGDLPFSAPAGARCAPVAATKGTGIPFTEIQGLHGDLTGTDFTD